MFTDGQMTDGRQAHRYIPRTFRSGDKKLEMSTIICAKHMVSEASVCSKLIGSWNLLTRFRCAFLTDKTRWVGVIWLIPFLLLLHISVLTVVCLLTVLDFICVDHPSTTSQ